MRKVLSVFIAACLVLSLFTGVIAPVPSARADITEGSYTYTVAGSNATITDYAGLGGVVVIPSTLGGHRVTAIGTSAFDSCTRLTSVTIPNSVTSIGYGAFAGCTGLTSVTIPNSVTTIGNWAFDSCYALTSVTIPKSVTSIGDGAFEYCTGLTEILVNGNNLNYASVGGVLYDKDITVLIQYPIGNTRTSFTIPKSVTSIGDGAFYGCTGLTSVTIPNSVTSIGDGAFGCTGLTSVTIPNSVTSIGTNSVTSIEDGAFYGCTALTSVTIGSGVTSIGIYAFHDCWGLTSVTIPNSVTSIGDWAFFNCIGLTSVTIPNSVTTIGDGVFEYCRGLTSVTIPKSVTSIGDGAFEYCTGLTEILVNGDNLNYASVGGVLYDKDITVLIQYPIGNTRTSFTIPNSVTSIGDNAFDDCTALTSVTIPNSVTSIGDGAFSGCTGLTSVTIPNSVTSIGTNSVTSIEDGAFYGCTGLTAAHFVGNAPTMGTDVFGSCAIGFTVKHLADTTGWTNPWYGYPTAIEKKSTKEQTVLVLHIGKSTFTVNGTSKTLDSPPVIKNGRTLVPIRAIIEALGGTVGWDATTKKATVTLGKKTIALWIGKSAATVNGVSTLIDSTNAKVVPEIISSRTMLPLRFVTENLGCSVVWAAATKTITITYQL